MVGRAPIFRSLLAATFISLIATTNASATVYCVPNTAVDPSCTIGQGKATLTAALTAANGAIGDDQIVLGAGTINDGPWAYSGSAGNNVAIFGAGIGQTILASPGQAAFESYVNLSDSGNSIANLTIDFPAANFNGDTGLVLSQGADASNVEIDGSGTTNTTGAYIGLATLSGLVVEMPPDQASGTRGIYSQGENLITDSTISGSQGLNLSSPNTTDIVSRVSFRSDSQGIVTDGGKVVVDDALIDLGTAPSATGLDANNSNNGPAAKEINARHVTIVGGGGGSTGARARAVAPGAKQKSVLTLNDSIIAGPAISIDRQADNDGAQGGPSEAQVTTSYSRYDATTAVDTNTANGTGTIAADHQTAAVPGFVNPASNFHLTAGSPLIDAGDPAAGGPLRDLDRGARVADGNEDGVVRRDIGAYEFQDTIAPVAAITTGPADPGNNPTPTFGFTSTPGGNNYRCGVDGGPLGPCSGPDTHTTAPLADGPHSFQLLATDASGNQGSATRSFVIDTAAPETAITSGPTALGNDPTPTFGFSSAPGTNTYACAIDGGPLGPCSGPGDSHTTATLADGDHSFQVAATDTAGNVDPSPASQVFTIDTKAPAVTITGGPKKKSARKKATFTFVADEPGATLECALDGAAFSPCVSPQRYKRLKLGRHRFVVRATDAVGNVGQPVSRSFKRKRKHPR